MCEPDNSASAPSCCCEKTADTCADVNTQWICGTTETAEGKIPIVSTKLCRKDFLGELKTRLDIGRMNYTVPPGLYGVGNPGPDSAVFVSANFKMSFDRLRSRLGGRNAWILVLDTKGINVWCAAGKGTFGTGEIVRRVEAARLGEIVSHRTLVAPQLGGPGVCAREVKQRCGFGVVFGPVRAYDLPAFLDAGMKATPEMRRVRFPFRDRAALIPVELIAGMKYALSVAALIFLLTGLGRDGFSFSRMLSAGLFNAFLIFAAYLAGTALTPSLLPWIPGRAFALKGAIAGVGVSAGAVLIARAHAGTAWNYASVFSWFLIVPAIVSFMGMNFTGSSTYTSLSGVKREMRIALPIQGVCAITGAALWIAGRFI